MYLATKLTIIHAIICLLETALMMQDFEKAICHFEWHPVVTERWYEIRINSETLTKHVSIPS